MRWLLLLVALAGCAHESPAPARAPATTTPESGPPEELLATPSAAPAQTLASRFETRRIGEQAPPARSYAANRQLVDLDVKDADVHDVLRLLADVGRVNIVVADSVSGRVTMRLKRVPWQQALDAVTSTKGLAVASDGDVIVVTAAGKAAAK